MDTKKLMKVETGPFPLLRQFQRDFDSLFEKFGLDRFNALDPARAFWVPDVEVFERDGELVVRADVPGLKKDEIKIELTDEELVIEGERKQDLEERRTASSDRSGVTDRSIAPCRCLKASRSIRPRRRSMTACSR
jgi:HSP20 family molecular chaperone IbpA